MSDFEELIGRRVTGLSVSDGEHWLVFDTDKGRLLYFAEGDCCSESWFADILGVPALIGHTVQSIEELPLENYSTADNRGRQEHDNVYGFKIVTDAGRSEVIFRNSSNGYYGGWLVLVDDGDPSDLRPITDDWAA